MLEVIIITYNRAEALERTLASLCPFRNRFSRILVFDNCSTDHTADVCGKFEAHIQYRKNPFNIGLEANLLRAWESAEADYLWVVCDDDEFPGLEKGLEEVEEMLNKASLDLVWVSRRETRSQAPSKGGLHRIQEFAHDSDIYQAISFIPSFIIKRSLFRSEDFFNGYKNIYNFYSFVGFFGRMIEENALVGVTRRPLVIRPMVSEASFPLFDVVTGWMIMNRFIPEQYHQVSLSALIGERSIIWSILKCILRQRLDWKKPTLATHLRALGSVPGSMKRAYVLTLPFSVLPFITFTWLRFVNDGLNRLRGIKRTRNHISAENQLRT